MAATTLGAPLLGSIAEAAVKPAASQNAGFYRFDLGDFQVTTVHDGSRTFPMPDGFVRNVPKETALGAAEAAYMPKGMVTVPYNPTLINTGSKLVLIDVGNGPAPDGKVGQLFPNLAAAGVRPEDIDIVLISHLHPDHMNGLRTTEGTLAFPNAEIRAPAVEWAFWMNDENMAKASDPVTKNYFANQRKYLAGFTDRIGTYEWGKEVAPGVTALATPGHTPGHTSFAVTSGGKSVLVQSDVTNIPVFFLQHPDWHVLFDYDPEQAQKTRHSFYDMAAAEKMPVIGFHFSFPSVGHVEKNGADYRLVPVSWSAVL
jgi:glyoxylase-like metal-dependent hydrolase (beta-lactamase superfamily II)